MKFSEDAFSISASSEKTIDSLKDEISVIPDENDRASKEAEFTLELRERERESRLEQKINYVLKKIENKSFGYCELCNNKIA